MADRAACRPRLRVDRVDRTTHSRARDAVRRGGQYPSRNSMDGGNHRANRRHGCGASPMDHSHTTTATATATSLVNFVATNVAICYRRRGNDVDTCAPRTGTSNLDAGHGNLGAVGRARTGWLVDSRHRNCNYRCRDCCGYRIIDEWVMLQCVNVNGIGRRATYLYNPPGNPTRLNPMPRPAPLRAEEPMLGM